MAVPAGVFSTGGAVGNREDLQDKIFMISPTETPFVTALGAGATATATKHEWQTDALAAPDANNAALEADQFTATQPAPTARLQNTCQIMRKVASVSGTQEVVKKAGRDSEMARQIAKRGQELKRDLEMIASGSQAEVTGTYASGINTVARRMRGFEHWVQTNVSVGAAYAAPGSATAAQTDGTQRAFTEALLKSALQLAYTEGGAPTMALLGAWNKQIASGFTGRASARQQVSEATILASASVYAGDFGDIKLMPSRFTRARSALLVDPEYCKIAWLRRLKRVPLARTGDSDEEALVAECTLQMGNEKAHGKVADLLTS